MDRCLFKSKLWSISRADNSLTDSLPEASLCEWLPVFFQQFIQTFNVILFWHGTHVEQEAEFQILEHVLRPLLRSHLEQAQSQIQVPTFNPNTTKMGMRVLAKHQRCHRGHIQWP